jgi:hypothetical protein
MSGSVETWIELSETDEKSLLEMQRMTSGTVALVKA